MFRQREDEPMTLRTKPLQWDGRHFIRHRVTPTVISVMDMWVKVGSNPLRNEVLSRQLNIWKDFLQILPSGVSQPLQLQTPPLPRDFCSCTLGYFPPRPKCLFSFPAESISEKEDFRLSSLGFPKDLGASGREVTSGCL